MHNQGDSADASEFLIFYRPSEEARYYNADDDMDASLIDEDDDPMYYCFEVHVYTTPRRQN